jgi:hypothetical protein
MRTQHTLSLPLIGLFAVIPLSAVRAQENPVMNGVERGSYQGVQYLSGGVGLEQREYIASRAADDYNLKLEFADRTGKYIAEVDVQIVDGYGNTVLQETSEGPWFFAQLKPGRYEVKASAAGRAFERSVVIGHGRSSKLLFNDWARSEG